MIRRQRCSMPRRPGGLRWRRPLTVLLGLTVLLALDGSGILRVGLGCALLHESGHALMYRLLWHHWPELEISPLGICLRLRGLLMTPAQELLLAAADAMRLAGVDAEEALTFASRRFCDACLQQEQRGIQADAPAPIEETK